MNYTSMLDCVNDLEQSGRLQRITSEVDPYLEAAAIQRKVYANQGPALLFTKLKGCRFPAVSNLFGTRERCRYIFRGQLSLVKAAIRMKADPERFLHYSLKNLPRELANLLQLPFVGLSSLPKKVNSPYKHLSEKALITDLPKIVSWPEDGGPFITLPQVLSQKPGSQRPLSSNVGMYRVQLLGNDYLPNKEVGMHYQLHRGLGIHHSEAIAKGQDLAVSIFVGGPPAHTVAAVMPLPEGLSELLFAGMLAGRRFRYHSSGDHLLSADADFCITGWLRGQRTKPEGPFGDHLGYYSLTHEFPVLEVDQVYHRKNAIWPFTVVGRPPQEDTSFGQLIHEMTEPMVPKEIPGVKALHAVDEAGVHPLLLAIGHERYVPYQELYPAEILTQANAILGFNQCSLAKYLLIAAEQDDPHLSCQHTPRFFHHMLKRIDWRRDLHFQTRTTMDTLDYSGEGLNFGSKVVWAACGKPLRELTTSLPENFSLPTGFAKPHFVTQGILTIEVSPTFTESFDQLCQHLSHFSLHSVPLIILCDDSEFTSRQFANFLWVTFTRSNPAKDIYGVNSFTEDKHWGCHGSLIIDARIKAHHAPELAEDPQVLRRIERFFVKGGCLSRWGS